MKRLLIILLCLPMIGFGQIFWDHNFDNPTDWTLDNNGQGTPNGWTIDNVVDSWYFNNPISSTSGGTFAELTNGDPSSSGPGTWPSNVTYTMTIANPIDVMALARRKIRIYSPSPFIGSMAIRSISIIFPSLNRIDWIRNIKYP